MNQRKIIHIDMDAFYASVEQRDNPSLQGKPIAVGGGGKRGVTTTASYEARKFGVRSAMPGFKARALCPELIFVPPRFDAYRHVSAQIRNIFGRYTEMVEPLSLDEAFLDVSDSSLHNGIATEIAKMIKHDILTETQLSCSAGISYCKFLAKLASDIDKPDGLTVIKPAQAISFIERLPIGKFFGIGKVTERKMNELGIYFGKDLKKWSLKYLIHHFGKNGKFFYNIARGLDDRPVQGDRKRKSLGVERTLEEDLSEEGDMLLVLDKLCDVFYQRLSKANNFGRTITLKIKTSDFKIRSRSKTTPEYIRTLEDIKLITRSLLQNSSEITGNVRLMGITASNLEQDHAELKDDGQMTLF